MIDRILPRLSVISITLCLLTSSSLFGQEPTGGGSLIKDLTGGAALIFRAPKDPVVHIASVVQGTTGGGKIKGGKKQTPPAPPVRKQDQIIARANAARSGPKPRYAEAEEQYRLAAQVAPDDARAFAGLGNVFVDQGRFSEAVDQALKVKPDYNAALLPLAFSLARMDRYQESIDIYQQALKVEPSNPEIFNNLSFAYNHTNRYQDAVDASLTAVKLLGETGQAYTQGFQERNESLSYAYKNLGNAYNGMNRYEEAANALKRAAEIEPTNASAHFNLGLTLYNAGRYSEAIEAYRQVIKLRPTLAQAHYNLGLTYFAVSDRKQALGEYEVLKTMNPALAEQLFKLLK
jgi:tetratricopeptide (TPR) repeat protein